MTVADEQIPDAAPLLHQNGRDRLSVLGQLADRRQEIVEEDLLVLPVPRWQGRDPEIFIRFRPLEHTLISSKFAQVERAPVKERPQLELRANTDLLIAGCVGVFGRVAGDPAEYSLKVGEPLDPHTKFDDELAENLGLPEHSTARQVVKQLFIVDGDVISAGKALTEFSGYRENAADDALVGE